MRKLHYVYDMRLDFSEPVLKHEYTLKCFPQSDSMQQISAVTIRIQPRGKQFTSSDSFGNKTICGVAENRHRRFEVRTEGYAVTGMDAKRPAVYSSLGKFRYASSLTKSGPGLLEYAALNPFSGGNLKTAYFYMESINRDMMYAPGITCVDTTAEQAILNRQGVCQDYAHILLALLRMKRIPARYVCGMMEGEGASHAWVEVEEDGFWYGFDPTNGRTVDDNYIFVSSGRDAFDCQINKGSLRGGGSQRQSVSVIVTDEQPA